jgi:hypothetical protein
MGAIIVLAWLVGSSVCGYVARQKGRSDLGWIILALLISPLLALIALAALPELADKRTARTAERKRAPRDMTRGWGWRWEEEIKEDEIKDDHDESTRPPWARPRPRD